MIKIGDWIAEPTTRRLSRQSTVRTLEPKVMDLLLLLSSEPGRVFKRDAILESLWPSVTVGDESLARCVSKLRQALDDDARSPRYVATVSRSGYRLVAEVSNPANLSGAAGDFRTSQGLGPRRTILIALVTLALVAFGFALSSTMRGRAVSQEEARLQALSEIDQRNAIVRDGSVSAKLAPR